MTKIKFKLKTDTYRKARGGYSRFLDVACAACKSHLLLYQKDGPGSLKRLYCDRIFSPEHLSDLHKKYPLKKIPKLECPKCKTTIGMPMEYEKESRACFHLRPGTFTKKITRSPS